jgi:hypothetical protein
MSKITPTTAADCGVELLTGDEIVDVLHELLDELAKRVGLNEPAAILGEHGLPVSTVAELYRWLDELRPQLSH